MHQAADGNWYEKCPLCAGEGWHNEWVTGRQVMCHYCKGDGTVLVKRGGGCRNYMAVAAAIFPIAIILATWK